MEQKTQSSWIKLIKPKGWKITIPDDTPAVPEGKPEPTIPTPDEP